MSRNPSARYTAEEVEKHPWISRRFDDEIPLSAHEVMNSFSLEQSFTRVSLTPLKSFIQLFRLDYESIVYYKRFYPQRSWLNP